MTLGHVDVRARRPAVAHERLRKPEVALLEHVDHEPELAGGQLLPRRADGRARERRRTVAADDVAGGDAPLLAGVDGAAAEPHGVGGLLDRRHLGSVAHLRTELGHPPAEDVLHLRLVEQVGLPPPLVGVVAVAASHEELTGFVEELGARHASQDRAHPVGQPHALVETHHLVVHGDRPRRAVDAGLPLEGHAAHAMLTEDDRQDLPDRPAADDRNVVVRLTTHHPSSGARIPRRLRDKRDVAYHWLVGGPHFEGTERRGTSPRGGTHDRAAHPRPLRSARSEAGGQTRPDHRHRQGAGSCRPGAVRQARRARDRMRRAAGRRGRDRRCAVRPGAVGGGARRRSRRSRCRTHMGRARDRDARRHRRPVQQRLGTRDRALRRADARPVALHRGQRARDRLHGDVGRVARAARRRRKRHQHRVQQRLVRHPAGDGGARCSQGGGPRTDPAARDRGRAASRPRQRHLARLRRHPRDARHARSRPGLDRALGPPDAGHDRVHRHRLLRAVPRVRREPVRHRRRLPRRRRNPKAVARRARCRSRPALA